jgi:hypothetical protein
MLTAGQPRDYKAGTVTVAARCDECRFWIIGEQWGDQQKNPPDERLGACHRNAPIPTMGSFEYRVLQALVLIVPKQDNSEEDYSDLVNHWEDARLQEVSWPTTTGQDFCGEFSKRNEPC